MNGSEEKNRGEIEEYVRMRPYETKEMNLERRRVFFLVLGKTDSIEQAITFANIHNNTKYLNCQYPETLTNRLHSFFSA